MNVVFYLVFNFIFYSFIGWILEEGYSFSTTKKFQEDGFLIGPFKPMYGTAVTFLIICNELLDISGIPLILLCFLIPTTVEYISGYILKHYFNKVYWDYSEFRYNIHGFVTLRFSIYWMVLSLIGLYYLQPSLYELYMENMNFLNVFVVLGGAILLIDLYITVKKLAYEKLRMIQ